jgi:predicted dehydrogenase
MGKRRVRNLLALGYTEIAGFDIRADRVDEAVQKYGIIKFDDFDSAWTLFRPDACIISTSPAQHIYYAFRALALNLSCFIEASVTDAARILELHERTAGTLILMAPSCTMRYFPGPCRIKELVTQGVIGKVLNINYHTGQYLPDWHPWEGIMEYYVSQRETGGCREIVPFELTWINDIFGEPEPLALVKAKLTDMDADIDDIYHCLLRYPLGILANITVEVVSRPAATREMRILGSLGEIVFSADENSVRWISKGMKEWARHNLATGTVEAQYINPEEPYIAEMRDFAGALISGDKTVFPNTLFNDYKVLQTLCRLESLSEVL